MHALRLRKNKGLNSQRDNHGRIHAGLGRHVLGEDDGPRNRTLHINVPELLSVKLALTHFWTLIVGSHVLIGSDCNTVTVALYEPNIFFCGPTFLSSHSQQCIFQGGWTMEQTCIQPATYHSWQTCTGDQIYERSKVHPAMASTIGFASYDGTTVWTTAICPSSHFVHENSACSCIHEESEQVSAPVMSRPIPSCTPHI